jgi:tRNA1Val (adenine37-N6)-methyltransferase
MFHFKKFSIDDSNAAMKIGTDAVLLGAWADCKNATHVLDIGTGSGILALMMAQRNPDAVIIAVEIDPDAAGLAKENVKLSPWPDRIQVYNTSFQEFSMVTKYKFNLVICNPPFFTNSLKSPGKSRNLARHNDSLPVSELLKFTSDLLTDPGKAFFIIPANDFENWKQEAAKHSLFVSVLTFVRSTSGHNPHRVLVMFTKQKPAEIIKNNISIYISNSIYTPEYVELTKDFYLNF